MSDDLWSQIESQYIKNMQSIAGRVEELFKQAVRETIYDYYTPSTYDRTYMFLNSVKAHFDYRENALYVYSDINTGYYSAVDGSDQTQNISKWLEYGHSDGIGETRKGHNQYHQFEGRNYLERAQELIKGEFPDLNIEIISED